MDSSDGIKRYRSMRALGTGTFGDVYHVKEALNDKDVALKAVDWQDLSESSKLTAINEVDVLCRLKHSSIVGYKGCFTTNESVRQNLGFVRSEKKELQLQDGDMAKTRNVPSCPNQEGHTLCVLMEYADYGDLSDHIKTTDAAVSFFDEKTMWKYVVQLCSGVGMLHSQKILHRDLKPQNILVTKEGDLIVADLGIASDNILNRNNEAKTNIGTPRYQAPEMFKGKTYNAACDVWAMGAIIYELMTLKNPFHEANNILGLVNMVCNQEPKSLSKAGKMKYSSALKGLVSWMMMKKPSQRPTSLEIWAYISKHVDGVLLGKYNSNNTIPWTKFELENAEKEIFALENYKRLENYKPVRVLSSSESGIVNVYEVEHVPSKERFAMKTVIWEPLDATQRSRLITEVATAKETKHSHLAAYTAHFKHRGDVKEIFGFGKSPAKYMPEDPEDPFKIFCLVTPLGSHTLEASINSGVPLNEADIWRFLLQSVAGIAHVHNTQQRGINGLTPSGMLVDKKGNVSLQSVSVQRAMRIGDCSEVHPSIYRYMSPELIQGMPTGYTSDTWSLGCIAYELAVLTPAFKGTSTNELMSKMTSLQYYPVLDEKSTIMSSELRTCIKWMLQQDPADRPTMQQLYLYIIQLDKKLRGDFELSAGDHTFSMDITCVPGGYKNPSESKLEWPASTKSPAGGRYLSNSSSSGGTVAECVRNLQRRPSAGPRAGLPPAAPTKA